MPATWPTLRVPGALAATLVAAAVLQSPPRASAGQSLLVCSSGGNAVQSFSLASDGDLEFVTSGGGISYPWGAARGADGLLYVSGFGSHAIFRYDGATGAYVDQFVATRSGGLLGPGDLEFGADGALYVSSMYSSEILRYDAATGAFLDVFVADGSGGLNSPRGIAFGPGGDLFVVNHYGGEVLRYDGRTGASLGVFAEFGFGAFDGDLAFGPDGDLFVTLYQDDAVARFEGQSGAFVDFAVPPFGSTLDGPMGIAFDDEGAMYVASYLGGVTKHDAVSGDLLDVLLGGESSPTMIAIVADAAARSADLDGDGVADGADLAILLGAWGTAGPDGDLNADGRVDGADLSLVLGQWG